MDAHDSTGSARDSKQGHWSQELRALPFREKGCSGVGFGVLDAAGCPPFDYSLSDHQLTATKCLSL